MQPLITRLRSLRRERFDSSTGRRKRGGAAVAAGLALALFAGSGIAIAAVSTASAHTPNIESDCTGVHVRALDYNAELDNTVTIDIPGVISETIVFNGSFDQWFTVPDPSQVYTYSVSIDALDDTDDDTLPEHVRWDYSQSGTVGGCSAPDIGITASACQHVGDKTTVDATISRPDLSHAYTVQLIGTDGSDSGVLPLQADSYQWTGLEPGYDYTATVTDTTAGLSDTDTVSAVGCPQDPSFEVSAQQCKIDQDSGSVDVTVSGLVAGRNYVLSLVPSNGGASIDFPFQAAGDSRYYGFTSVTNGTYTVALTDVVDNSSKSSNPVTVLPCPKRFPLDVTAQQCTSTDGVANGSLTWSTSGLVPGRSYTAVVTTFTNPVTTVHTESLTPATSSTWSRTLTSMPSGDYIVTLTDTTEPGGVSTTSGVARILPCPTQPEVSITPTECTVPGGAASLTATISGISANRIYEITLYEGSQIAQLADNPLPPQGRVDNDPIVVSWSGLKPGVAYRVVVVDQLEPTIKAAADILLTDCPGNPELTITQPPCTILTTTTITTTVGKLLAGETYTVSVTTTKDGKPVPGVPDQQVDGTNPTASLQFANLPVGATYTVTIVNATKTLTASGDILLILCDLPTLAYTGASTMTPTLAGLGFLQFGLVLVGISLVRRRSGAREV